MKEIVVMSYVHFDALRELARLDGKAQGLRGLSDALRARAGEAFGVGEDEKAVRLRREAEWVSGLAQEARTERTTYSEEKADVLSGEGAMNVLTDEGAEQVMAWIREATDQGDDHE